MNTLRALEEAIEQYAGCVMVISHDRWFLDRVCTHLLEEIAVSYLLLRVSDYLEDHEDLEAPEKVRLLALWDELLHGRDVETRFAGELATVPHRSDDPEAIVARQFGILVGALRSFSSTRP